jgi:hypothetical protein
LDDRLGGVRVSRHEVLHVGVTKRTGHCQNAVDAVVQDQTAGTCDPFAFVLIASFMVVGQSKRLSVTAEDDACISNVCGIEDALTRRRLPEFAL